VKTVFLIRPVRESTYEEEIKIQQYKKKLEANGYLVYDPKIHTKQEDFEGGINICTQNFSAMWWKDEVHVWFSSSSSGSRWDVAMMFSMWMLNNMKLLPVRCPTIIVANPETLEEAIRKIKEDGKTKDFTMVLRSFASMTQK
jgi:hypothetical protein